MKPTSNASHLWRGWIHRLRTTHRNSLPILWNAKLSSQHSLNAFMSTILNWCHSIHLPAIASILIFAFRPAVFQMNRSFGSIQSSYSSIFRLDSVGRTIFVYIIIAIIIVIIILIIIFFIIIMDETESHSKRRRCRWWWCWMVLLKSMRGFKLWCSTWECLNNWNVSNFSVRTTNTIDLAMIPPKFFKVLSYHSNECVIRNWL